MVINLHCNLIRSVPISLTDSLMKLGVCSLDTFFWSIKFKDFVS